MSAFASKIQSSDLLDLGMLDLVEKDPMAPTSEGRVPSPIPRAEPPIGVTAPSELNTSEPGEAAQPQELTLVPRERPLPPPGFSLWWADESAPPPLEQAGWTMQIPWGAWLDFASLESIWVTLTLPVMDEVHCSVQVLDCVPDPGTPTISLAQNPWINPTLKNSEQM